MNRPLLSAFCIFALVASTVGCGPTPQEQYDTALGVLQKERAELDRLLPANRAARREAMDAVCKELAGMTGAEAKENMQAAVDGLIPPNSELLDISGKVAEIVSRINTAGTSEAKRFEEIAAKLPDCMAYRWQQERVKRAELMLAEAESKL